MSPLEFMQRLAALVPAPAENASGQSADHAHAQPSPARMSWARLLKRVFDIDLEHCPQCGGALKIIAAIEDPPVIARLLAHLGLPTGHHRACPRAASICSKRPEPSSRPDPSRSAPALMPALGLRSRERPTWPRNRPAQADQWKEF